MIADVLRGYGKLEKVFLKDYHYHRKYWLGSQEPLLYNLKEEEALTLAVMFSYSKVNIQNLIASVPAFLPELEGILQVKTKLPLNAN